MISTEDEIKKECRILSREGHSYASIGKQLNLPKSTVARWVKEGKKIVETDIFSNDGIEEEINIESDNKIGLKIFGVAFIFLLVLSYFLFRPSITSGT